MKWQKRTKKKRNESKYGTEVSGARLNGPERERERERERESKSKERKKQKKIPFEFASPAHLKERKVEINLTSFNTALVSQTL